MFDVAVVCTIDASGNKYGGFTDNVKFYLIGMRHGNDRNADIRIEAICREDRFTRSNKEQNVFAISYNTETRTGSVERIS